MLVVVGGDFLVTDRDLGGVLIHERRDLDRQLVRIVVDGVVELRGGNPRRGPHQDSLELAHRDAALEERLVELRRHPVVHQHALVALHVERTVLVEGGIGGDDVADLLVRGLQLHLLRDLKRGSLLPGHQIDLVLRTGLLTATPEIDIVT